MGQCGNNITPSHNLLAQTSILVRGHGMQSLSIHVKLAYDFAPETDCLFQFEVAHLPQQRVRNEILLMPVGADPERLSGESGIGTRFWLHHHGPVTMDYRVTVEVDRAEPPLNSLSILPPHRLPSETLSYIMASRYCDTGAFQNFVTESFGAIDGGAKVDAMRQWIADHMSYQPGSSDANTTAQDSFVRRAGVCRDYAHLMIVMARAAAIPARMVSVYAPHVEPQDFHAVAQLYLADGSGRGAWHFVDATGMARAEDIALIGVGRDAADIAFMTLYGGAEFIEQSVIVHANT